MHGPSASPGDRRLTLLLSGLSLALSLLAGCTRQSDVERQREANVAAAERESHASPWRTLPRSGALTQADRAAWRTLLQWPDGCEQAHPASGPASGSLAFHPAGVGVTLVAVECRADAQRPTHVLIRLDERGSSPTVTTLRFPRYESVDGREFTEATVTELTGEIVFAADGHALSVLTPGDVAGNCGMWTRYAIGGEHPRRLAATFRLPCVAPAAPPATMAAGGASPAGWLPVPGAALR